MLQVLCQRTEEIIDSEVQSRDASRFEQMQHALEDRHVLVGRNDIDVIWFFICITFIRVVH